MSEVEKWRGQKKKEIEIVWVEWKGPASRTARGTDGRDGNTNGMAELGIPGTRRPWFTVN